MTTPTAEPETGEQWLVDGATVYKLHIPHDPRYEKGRPCPENRLSFHVQQGRGVLPEEARQMARHAAYALNSVTELERERDALREEVTRLTKLIDTPHTDDWLRAVPLEAAHQVKRWGVEHDVGKTPFDWFWLIGYLAQKAAASAVAGDVEKAKHHTVSTGAVLLNWFKRLTGDDTLFQPGVDPQQRGAAAALGETK